MEKRKRRFRYDNNVMAMVMAGGQGASLHPFADKRATPAIDVNPIASIRSIKIHKQAGKLFI